MSSEYRRARSLPTSLRKSIGTVISPSSSVVVGMVLRITPVSTPGRFRSSFFFTGPHSDYHRPSDTVDKLNGEGLAEVARFVYRVIEHLANRPERVTYVQVKEPPPAARGRGYGAYFGVVPDFGSQEEGGVRLSGVRPGSPAEKIGLQEGDIIVTMAGVRVKNLHDMAFVLRSKRAGDKVEVGFFRDGQEMRGRTTLERRR